MGWFFFASIAIVAYAIVSLISRHVMRTENAFAYAFTTYALAGVLFIPFLIVERTLPLHPMAWVLVLVSSVLWVGAALAMTQAYKETPVSLREPLHQTNVLVVFVLSVLILGETITVMKAGGVLLVFAGVAILTYKQGERLGRLRDRRVQLTLLGAFFTACAAIADKAALQYFPAGTLAFLLYAIPAAGIYSLLKIMHQDASGEIQKLWARRRAWILLVAVLGAIMYYALLQAYLLAEVSLVRPILNSSAVLTAALGILIWKEEREHLIQKAIGACVVAVGAGVLLL